MSGRAFGTRFTFIWPSAKIAVMGPKQMAGVMSIVQRKAAERRGLEFDEEADLKRAETAEFWAEERSKGLFATSRVSDDGMIDPRDTRTVVGFALSVCHNETVEGTKEFGTWRM
jgi:acetyl-CoA carboxylase carboxyltransferase component